MNEKIIDQKIEIISEDSISIKNLFKVLYLYKKRFIVGMSIVFIFSLSVLILSKFLPPEKNFLPDMYRSDCKILVNDMQNSMTGVNANSSLLKIAGINNLSDQNAFFIIEVIKSKVVADAVINKFNFFQRFKMKKKCYAKMRAIFFENLKVDFNEETNIITVEFEDFDVNFTCDVLEFILSEVEKELIRLNFDKDSSLKIELENKLADVSQKIKNLQNHINAFQKKYNIFDIVESSKLQIQKVNDLKLDLLRKELLKDSFSTYSSISNIEYLQLEKEITNLKNLIYQLENNYYVIDDIHYGPPVSELPDLNIKFTNLVKELEVQMEIYKTLVQQYELNNLKLSTNNKSFQVIQEPVKIDYKVGPKRSIILLMIIFISAIVLTFFFLLHYYNNKKMNMDLQ